MDNGKNPVSTQAPTQTTQVKQLLSNSPEVKALIQSQTILRCRVTRCIPFGSANEMLVRVSVFSRTTKKEMPGIIYPSELDAGGYKVAAKLIGTTIPFTVIGADDEQGRLICSRKAAQLIIKDQMLDGLTNNGTFEGTVVGFTHYGAYIEVNGLTGMMHNADFSSDHSRVEDCYKIGDTISVCCNKFRSGDDGRSFHITWKPVVKYRRTTPVNFDFEVGMIMEGRVVAITQLTQSLAVFVRLQDEMACDVMCAMPENMEVERFARVIVKLTRVEPGPNAFSRPKLRGRILQVN